MAEKFNGIQGKSSWSQEFGNNANSNMSSMVATAVGEVLWSVSLPNQSVGAIVVSEDGSCFLNTGSHLIAVNPKGEISWIHQSKKWVYMPILLENDQIIVFEDGQLLVGLDQKRGNILWSLPENRLTTVKVTLEGTLLLSQHLPERTPCLKAVTLTGELLWSVPLSNSLIYPPLILNNLIISESPSYLQARDLEGRLLWIANQEGFQIANSTNREHLATKVNHPLDGFYTPIMDLGKGQILAGLSWYDGSGLYIFDLNQHQVRPWPIPETDNLWPRLPLAVVSLANRDPYLAVLGGDRKTLLVNLQGEKLWEVQTYKKPQTLIADAKGQVFMVHSPSREIWDKYKQYYNLEDKCFVKGFDLQGQELFSWGAPGPLSNALAIGQAGEIYCVSEGQLWAIG